MNEKKFIKPINLMVKELIKNDKKSGFPVAAIFMHRSWEKYEVAVNKKSKDGETHIENHAETICYFNLENIDSEHENKKILIISIPPCSHCLQTISENKNIVWEIYYIFDDVREKMRKKYLKNFNDGKNKIEILDFSKFKSINLKFEIYFIIMKCLKGFLNHKLNGISKEKLEIIAIKWLKKLNNDINNSDQKIDIEMEEEINIMIKKIKEWDVSNMNTLKDKKGKEKWIV